jgi:acyl CoA:acetate/3-ketoacid CoA transferase beta subunit
MPKAIRNAILAALTAVLIAGAGLAAAGQSDPSGSESAPGMAQGDDQMPGMGGMMSMMKMMERMTAMMTLCEKMMETAPSAQEGDPT